MAKGGSWAAHVRLCLAALAVAFVGLSEPAFAQSALKRDCASLATLHDRTTCHHQSLTEGKRAMDESLAAAQLRLDYESYLKLVDNQRAWVKSLNGTCGLDPDQSNVREWYAKVVEDSAKASCVVRETRQRIAFVAEYRGAPSAPPATVTDCENLGPGERTTCLERNLREADGLIDKTYQAARARMDEPGKIRLRDEQRAWLKTRNQTCSTDSGQGDREAWLQGILKDSAKTACVAGMIRARINELNRYSGTVAPPAPEPKTPETVKVEPPAPPVAPPPSPPVTEPAPPPVIEKPAPVPPAAAPAHEEGQTGGLLRPLGLVAALLAVVFLLYRYGRSGIRALAPFFKRVAATVSKAAMNRAPAANAVTSSRASSSRAARSGSPRRYRWFKAVIIALWCLFVAQTVISIAADVAELGKVERPDASFAAGIDPNMSPYYRAQTEALREQQARQYAASVQRPLDNLAINVWALLGAAVLAWVGVNPLGWIGLQRMIWGGLALGLCVGSLIVSPLVYYALGYLPFARPAWLDLLLWFFGFPVAMVLCSTLVFSVVIGTVTATFSFLVGVPVFFFNQIMQFDQMLHINRYQRSGLSSYIIRFVYWLTGETLPAPPPDDSRGARFAVADEIGALHDPAGMAFGHVGGSPLFIHTEKHVLLMGGTRSGKGVSLIVPHLLRYRGSAFVLDPKGENAKATGRHRTVMNDLVHYLDPFGISGKPRSRFNPLARFTPDNMEAESKALAAALVLTHDNRDHWTAAGQQLLAALILHVVTSENIPPASKDLPTVRRLLLNDVKGVLADMELNNAADDLVSALANSFLKTPDKEFGSIVSTAQRETEILDNPFIIASLSASGPGEEVDFKAWRYGTMTVYLCLAAPKFPNFNRWLRLVLTSALDEMTDTLDPPPLPVCFMLDELATLGHLQPVENAVGLAAGYGIQLVTVFQDVPQMRDLYKGRWASFINNAGVRALFALDDYDTASYWSKFIGSHVINTKSQQQDIYGLTSGQNVGEAVRPLLTPEQIMMRYAAGPEGTGTMLVLPEGSHPVETDKVPYFRDAALKGLWDDPRAATTPAPPAKPGPLLLTAE